MKYVTAIFIFFLFSCEPPLNEEVQIVPSNNTHAKTSLPRADTTKIIEEKVEISDEESARIAKNKKPLLIARGSEPGWYAEFFADHLRLLIENGTDSLTIEKDFSDINAGSSYASAIAESGNGHDKIVKTTAMSIAIENKNCTEEGSGEKREKSITIKFNGKTYKGCATSKVN